MRRFRQITRQMMMLGRYAGWMAGWLASIGLALGAAPFAPPNESMVAFRRDQIPLDADTMTLVATQLTSLAKSLKINTPTERRATTQTLALALALDPSNAKARELMAECLQGRHHPTPNPEALATTRGHISQLNAWLETPAAGKHGQALAACLKDILSLSDPQHPSTTEAGAWAAWVPELAAYQPKPDVKNTPQDGSQPNGSPTPKNPILLSKAAVHAMLWRNTGSDEVPIWVLAPAPLQMTASKVPDESENPHPFAVVIEVGEAEGLFYKTSATILNLLKKSQPQLPQGFRISITSKALEQSVLSRKRQSISAAAAVLASAALTGREPEAIIIGQIDEAGTFKLPSACWDQLASLGAGSGQRLILPAAAAEILLALLALEKPAFFLEYEVLLAANLQQLLDLADKSPNNPLAVSSSQFRETRDRIGSQDIRQYIANRFVKQRLSDILQATPCHFSAKMLLVQASGNRPTLLTRAILAAELRRAIEPMAWIYDRLAPAPPQLAPRPRITPALATIDGLGSAEIARLLPCFERCRSKIDALERYANKNDRELVERTRKLVATIRSLEKATRARSDAVTEAVQLATTELTILYKQTIEALNQACGDSPPTPTP